MIPAEPNIRTLANALSRGTMRCEQLIEERLERAHNSEGVFVSVDDGVIELAREIDQTRTKQNLPPLAGIPLSVKDLFSVKGHQTLAGSRVLRKSAVVEEQDCEVIDQLRQAGLLFLGRTNMSEFAFSGMGLNPHHPPLYSVWDRTTGRLPGGSSSGSAVSVALGIVPATMGSDTAGSCRIPAAFNGIVGVKPSYNRFSLNGIYPLSPTSDAPGPLGLDVDSCFIIDQVMSGAVSARLPTLAPVVAGTIRLLIPEGIVLENLDPEVESTFNSTISCLQDAGVSILRQPMPVIDDCVTMFNTQPVAVFEAWQHHQEMLTTHGDEYDPYVSRRITYGRDVTAEDQAQRYIHKASLIERFNMDFAGAAIDAVIYPTVPCIPPAITETKDPEKIGGVNLRCLRNTATANYFDGCSISLPCHGEGEAPVGLMLSCRHGEDQKMFQLAAAVEAVLARRT